MPVVGVNAAESPDEAIGCETLADHWILEHIIIVIVIDELVCESLAENGKGQCGQRKTNP